MPRKSAKPRRPKSPGPARDDVRCETPDLTRFPREGGNAATPSPRRAATTQFIPCRIAELPHEHRYEAAKTAFRENPVNAVRLRGLPQLLGRADEFSRRQAIAVLTTKWWGAAGLDFTVGFIDPGTPAALQDRIVSHMNAWSECCAARFTIVQGAPQKAQVRVTLRGEGYWSYLGTDVIGIPRSEPTMCLQDFSQSTPEAEYHRVVRHETGHSLGCPHEHMRQELVARLDPEKTTAYFQSWQGWSPDETRAQVLTPITESSIRGTPQADQDSIMCYQLPGFITRDGQPIRGGEDIDDLDKEFMSKVYPKTVPAPAAAGGVFGPPAVSSPASGGGVLDRIANIEAVIAEILTAVNRSR